MINIKLKTDFYDYYDHWFIQSHQPAHYTLERMTQASTTRLEDFELMRTAGLNVIPHDTVEKLAKNFTPEQITATQLVVYVDDRSHAGEGKALLTIDKALKHYPERLASLYVPTNLAETYRHLRIGTRQFWLRYTSDNDWRSNCGDVNFEFLSEEESSIAKNVLSHYSPLLAIDFIKVNERMVAIDLNPAPKIYGTGIENVMRPKEVFAEIKGMYALLHNELMAAEGGV